MGVVKGFILITGVVIILVLVARVWWNESQPIHHRKIPGPAHFTDKIAIVGAGPAGLHMAYLLKKKGFKNIKIFEASGRVGGKSYSFNHNGVPQEMGSVYLSNDENTMSFINDIGVKVGPEKPRETCFADGRPMWVKDFALRAGKKYLNTSYESVAMAVMIQAALRYNMIHKSLFGRYKGRMIQRPSKAVLTRARGTLQEFLERNQLSILKDICSALFSSCGYGTVNDVPALYFMILIKRFQKQEYSIVPSGMQSIWETVVSHSKLNVIYNAKVVKLRRYVQGGRRKFLLTYAKKHNSGISSYRHEFADFVIWTPEMKTSLNAMSATEEERKVFNRTRNYYYTSILVEITRVPRSLTPTEIYVDSIMNKQYNTIWSLYDSYGAQGRYVSKKYNRVLLPSRQHTYLKRYATALQLSKTRPKKVILNKTSQNDRLRFEKIGKTVTTKIWRYFPHYSAQDIEKGILWDIVDMQGKEGIWYLGSSVYFESLNAVVDYNNFVVDSMVLPSYLT